MKHTPPHVPNFRRVLDRAATSALRVMREEVQAFAEQERDGFKARIERQTFKSFRHIFYPESQTNLSPRWVKRKRALKLDPRTYIASGNMLHEIRVIKVHTPIRQGTWWRIGFERGKFARLHNGKRAKITLEHLAWILEKGSQKAHIPARPAWGPHRLVLVVNARKARSLMRHRIVRQWHRERII